MSINHHNLLCILVFHSAEYGRHFPWLRNKIYVPWTTLNSSGTYVRLVLPIHLLACYDKPMFTTNIMLIDSNAFDMLFVDVLCVFLRLCDVFVSCFVDEIICDRKV